MSKEMTALTSSLQPVWQSQGSGCAQCPIAVKPSEIKASAKNIANVGSVTNVVLQSPPPAPDPAKDASIVVQQRTSSAQGKQDPSSEVAQEHERDVFDIPAEEALRLMCRSLEAIVEMTGDVPPTPPLCLATLPSLKTIEIEKECKARIATEYDWEQHDDGSASRANGLIATAEQTACGQPPVIGANAEPTCIQHNAITRKFYSKKPPPIAVMDYVQRLHHYCPMSTAVYLAASLYIHRLAITERIIPVTSRNVHRLLLAGLRVAMKAQEDISYPHRRFARVGGVSEAELGRLEISFCFVANFELKVSREMLQAHADLLRSSKWSQAKPEIRLKMRDLRRASALPSTADATPETMDEGTS
ncbi:MAG: hypothetical protein M1817_001280 [Caeruleum heppii]|nr:MAG: hypothetical protein M1817_001280 [Caeruleum heppii]